MANSAPLRVAVIGAGPIGLEAALYAKALGFAVTVFEKGETADNLGKWGHVRLFTPFGWNHTRLGLDIIRKEHPAHALPGPNDVLSGTDYRDAYLLPLTLTSALCDSIRIKTEVLHVGRSHLSKGDPPNDPRRASSPFRILSRDDKQREQADEFDAVLDCSGTYGNPRWLGAGGIPAIGERAAAPHIAYGVEDILGQRRAHYAGRTVLVLGGGYSAATTVCDLATLAEQNPATWIVWLNRNPRRTPLPRTSSDPLPQRDRLAARANHLASRGEGHIEYHSSVLVESIESHGPDRGFRIAARLGSEEMIWEVERVIANVGYRPGLRFCEELHVTEEGVRQPEPNYFLLGARSRGRDSDFLLRSGYDAIREVFAQLLNKPRLDLYQSQSPRLAA